MSTTRTLFSVTGIPVHRFDAWIFAEESEFPKGLNDVPPLIKAKGMKRVGFVPRGSILVDDSLLTLKGTTFRLKSISLYDYVDHTFTKKGTVEGWTLHKVASGAQSD